MISHTPSPSSPGDAMPCPAPSPARLSVGSEVEWTSHGGGGRATKRGRIVAVVPKGTDIDALKKDLAHSHDLSPVMLCGQSRDAESFLVEVTVAAGRKPKLYWPRVEALHQASPDAVPPRSVLTAQSRQLGLFRGGHHRRLLGTGRDVLELSDPVEVSVRTRCPEKWALVDLETGQVWTPNQRGELRPAVDATLKDLVHAVQHPREVVRGSHIRRRRPRAATAID